MCSEGGRIETNAPGRTRPPSQYLSVECSSTGANVAFALLAAFALTVGLAGCGKEPPPATAQGASPSTTPPPVTTIKPAPTTTSTTLVTLPRGGRRLFPDYRVVAFYGGSDGPALGVLGEAPAEKIGPRLLKAAKPFAAAGRPVMPAFELIGTVANAHPTPSGLYRTRTDLDVVQRYLDAVRELDGLLVIDVQPGRGDFLEEVRYYERFLREPDVGIAIDPEWKMEPGEVPGRRIGHTDAATVNKVSAYVAAIVKQRRLPEKLFVVHQFTSNMVRGKEKVARRPGLAMTFHVDGFGGQLDKKEKYRVFTRDKRWHNGFKLFYDEDIDLMTPAEAMRLTPKPDLVTYQ
jgi:hypothetical protein